MDKLINTLNTPVLFLVFNRPDTTQQVFNQIKLAQPKQLFIAADGPRLERTGEVQKCEQVKQIVSQITWDCEVKTLFRIQNLGCGKAVSSAINWFFAHVDEGIILEDDCLPNLDFFNYCQEMLLKYRDNDTIMHISGCNLIKTECIKDKSSYYFSNYCFIWGWATWKKAWKHYDFNLNFDINVYEKSINEKFKNKFERKYWKGILQRSKNKLIDTWDYQWVFAVWLNKGISANTKINFIQNIGFGIDATHTLDVNHAPNLVLQNSKYAINPPNIVINKFYDKQCSKVFGILNNKLFLLKQFKRVGNYISRNYKKIFNNLVKLTKNK